MGRIFKSEDVIKIAEAVKIPDCVVRAQLQSLPESTIVDESETLINDMITDEQTLDDFISEEEEMYTEDETFSESDENNSDEEDLIRSQLYEAEYEKLLIERDAIIKQAQTEAAQLIAEAQAESQSIINDANEQAKSLLSSAREEGYREGVQAKQAEIEEFMLKINQCLAEMKMAQEEYFDKYADELKFLSLEIAEKIVAQKLEDDERVLFPLVRSAVKTLREVSWIKVEISDKLREVAYDLELILSEAKSSQSIEVELRRDADPGTCVVHTADGVIVASVLTQIENIREYFEQYKESDENEREA